MTDSLLPPTEVIPVRKAGDRVGALLFVDQAQEHPQRASAILKDHPEVRRLFGYNTWSGVILVAIVALQLSLAYGLANASWWVILAAAYLVGAFANHGLWVMVHECTHNLACKSKVGNRVLAVIGNLPMVLPSTIPFCIWHLKHHRNLGNCHHDADLPPYWESWLLRGGFVRRLIWQCCFPLLQSTRMFSLDHGRKPTSWVGWRLPNFAIQIGFVGLVCFLLGPKALIYLALSAFFSIGPHPLGARWIQEHYVFRDGQETYSYYGLLNLLAFNVGYHNEHHDMPQIPWNRLPALRRMAPEQYNGLFYHTSWVRLWLRFLFDRQMKALRIARDG